MTRYFRTIETRICVEIDFSMIGTRSRCMSRIDFDVCLLNDLSRATAASWSDFFFPSMHFLLAALWHLTEASAITSCNSERNPQYPCSCLLAWITVIHHYLQKNGLFDLLKYDVDALLLRLARRWPKLTAGPISLPIFLIRNPVSPSVTNLHWRTNICVDIGRYLGDFSTGITALIRSQ